jgi:hypothetical protein
MPQYVPKALSQFHYSTPKVPQHSPYLWTPLVYGQKVQLAKIDTSPQLDKKGTQHVQAVSGTFLYYARAVDPTILVALNKISNNQAKPTVLTGKACNMLLDFLPHNPS